MPRKTWFSIAQNKTDAKTADVSIHAEIGYWGITAKQFMEQLRLLGDGITTINLSIHSPGGEVLDGWAIYNALKLHPAKVIVTVKALAASMASVVMLAGDVIRIPKNAYVMIHRVSGGAWGDADQVKQMGETIAKLEDGIVAAYAERSGLAEKAIREMMSEETWLDGSEAVAKGFADEVLATTKAAALAGWQDHFTAAPAALFDTAASTDPANHIPDIHAMKPEEIQKLITDGIKAGLTDHVASQKDAIGKIVSESLKAEITAAIKTPIDEAMKPITDRIGKVEAFGEEMKKLTDRVEKAEGLVKAGITAAAGGTKPAEGGEGDDEGKDKAPANEAELKAALAKCKNFAERRQILNAYDKRNA